MTQALGANATQIEMLAAAFERTLVNPKEAENLIKEYEGMPEFISCLLSFLASPSMSVATKHAISIYFKNFIKSRWVQPDSDDAVSEAAAVISETDRNTVKGNILPTLFACKEKNIQSQIVESIILIAALEFPDSWPTLLDDLLSKMDLNDISRCNVGLRILHGMFKRFRNEARSNELFAMINFVLSKFAEFYLNLLKVHDGLLGSCQDVQQLSVILENLNLIVKIFYSFSTQDLPEFFEDHMTEFMSLFKKYLDLEENIAANLNNSVLEKLKASVCDVISLYSLQYDEEFSMLPAFVESVWNLLMRLGENVKYDHLVGHAVQILASVAKRHVNLLSSEQIITNICEKIIIPNVKIRDCDLELFEDEPLEYIKKDMEGLDVDSRRKSSIELTRSLMVHFGAQLTPLFMQYIDGCFKDHANSGDWRVKDNAINIFMAITMKGSLTTFGVSEINPLINVNDFVTNVVIPELQSAQTHPLVRIDCIRVALIFRNQIKDELNLAIFKLLVENLKNENQVVVSYCAICIDKFLAFKKQSLIHSQVLEGGASLIVIESCLKCLLSHGAKDGCFNDYCAKVLWKVIALCPQSVATSLQTYISNLITLIIDAARSPINPKYNHYLFEALVSAYKALVTFSKGAVSATIKFVFNALFQAVLAGEVLEFSPYVFQVYACILSSLEGKGLPEEFKNLLGAILQPTLWDVNANVPALVSLLRSYLQCDPSFIQGNYMNQFLGIFQKLLGSKQTEYQAFQFVGAMILYFPRESTCNFLNSILVLMLQRLQASKSPQSPRYFTIFVARFFLLSPSFSEVALLTETFNGIQSGLFEVLLEKFFAPEISKMVDGHEKAVVCSGFSKYLASSETVWNAANFDKGLMLGQSIFKTLSTLTGGLVEKSNFDAILEDEDRPVQAFSFSKLVSLEMEQLKYPGLMDPATTIRSLVQVINVKSPGSITSWVSSLGNGKDAIIDFFRKNGLNEDVDWFFEDLPHEDIWIEGCKGVALDDGDNDDEDDLNGYNFIRPEEKIWPELTQEFVRLY